MPATKKRWTAFVVAIAVLIATPLAVVASDVFTDVPDSNVFHDDITWLADAGVTKGCNPPDNTQFCPSDEVTREQMAAFMRRLAENKVVDAATAENAENADMLDGHDSSEFLPAGTIVTSVSGTAWLEHSASPANVSRFVSGTEFSADGAVVLPISAPQSFNDLTYGLAEVQICYETIGDGAIVELVIYRTEDDGDTDLVFEDLTTRSAAVECFTVSPDVSVGAGLGMLLNLDGGGVVRLNGTKMTWSTAAGLQSITVPEATSNFDR